MHPVFDHWMGFFVYAFLYLICLRLVCAGLYAIVVTVILLGDVIAVAIVHACIRIRDEINRFRRRLQWHAFALD